MKKLFMSLLLCSLAGVFACSKNIQETQDNETSVDSRKIAVPREAEESEGIESEDSESEAPDVGGSATNSDETSCNPKGGDRECSLIPATEGDCFGCMKGLAQRAVNKATREKVMGSMRKMCMPEVEGFMKNNKDKKPDMSNADQSCKFNAAKCSAEGQCVGVTLTKEEFEKRFPQKSGQDQGQGRPQSRPAQGSQRFGA